MKVFIDSNIPMYVAGRSHLNQAPARRFLDRVRAGDVDACTSTEVLQEILYRYSALGRLDLAERVYDLFVHICGNVLPVTLADTDEAKQLMLSIRGLSARDALHAAVMFNNGVSVIATYDAGFDVIPRLSRLSLT